MGCALERSLALALACIGLMLPPVQAQPALPFTNPNPTIAPKAEQNWVPADQDRNEPGSDKSADPSELRPRAGDNSGPTGTPQGVTVDDVTPPDVT
jgi:hypothetical protein